MAPKLPAVLLAACAVLLALAAPLLAGDPDMLQDICVADYKSLQGPLRVNGFPCKREANVTADDFFFGGLAKAADVYSGNPMGSAATAADVSVLPGLNTLGVSMARTDFAPSGGVSPPHVHPSATEILFVVEGTLEVGFVTAATNRLFSRTVGKGEVFVFPRGLVHFQRNVGEAPAVAISAFNSQLPGTQTVAGALFGAAPTVPTDVLARALQIDGGVIENIKSKFAPKYFQNQVKLPRGEVQAAGATHDPSDGCRRPPPPSPLVRPPSPRSEGCAELAPPPGETRCAEEGQPRAPAPLLRVFFPCASVSVALGRGRRRGVGRDKVGGVDPARRGRRRVGGGPRAGAQAHLSAAATPICQFVDSPRTFLHSVDPRVKLIQPQVSSQHSPSGISKQQLQDQLGRVARLSGFIFIMLGFGADGAPSLVQTRTPPPSVIGIPNIPCSTSGYSYTILKLGPLQFTRKGLSVASTSASLSFAIFRSASLCLTTTTPEQLASALWWFMIPLKHIGVPVPEIILTLLLSLRFINLVFDEIQPGSQLSSSDCSAPDKLEKADSYGNYRYFLQLCPADIQKYI